MKDLPPTTPLLVDINKKSYSKTKVLSSRYVYFCLIFLVVTQFIGATSTVWISDLGAAIVEGTSISVPFWLFIGSLLIAQIPDAIAQYNLDKAKSTAIYRYTKKFSKTHDCIPTLTEDIRLREAQESWLTKTSSDTIIDTFNTSYDSISLGTNSILNIGALAIFVNPFLAIGYLGFLSIPLVWLFFKKPLEERPLEAQRNNAAMSTTLLTGWDNITVGNIYNLSRWWAQFKNRFRDYRNSSASAVFIIKLSGIASTMIAAIPILGTTAGILYTTTDPEKLAALVITIPRQIQILQYMQSLSSQTMQWPGVLSKLQELFQKLNIPDFNGPNFEKRIKWQKLNISIKKENSLSSINNPPNSFVDFLNIVTPNKTGRITIRGENGTGKTTLINLFKRYVDSNTHSKGNQYLTRGVEHRNLSDRAIYLPNRAALFFNNKPQEGWSTGQEKKCYLEELFRFLASTEGSGTSYLLLDEWDGHLDSKNISDISNLLEEISKTKCVIEIRHRDDLHLIREQENEKIAAEDIKIDIEQEAITDNSVIPTASIASPSIQADSNTKSGELIFSGKKSVDHFKKNNPTSSKSTKTSSHGKSIF